MTEWQDLIINFTELFSSTVCCTFLVRLILLLANRLRLGYRIAFFDLVIGGMAEQITLGSWERDVQWEGVYGDGQLQVRSFFLYKLFAYMHSAY